MLHRPPVQKPPRTRAVLRLALLSLCATLGGMIATLGFMAMFGFSLNPANMIAFPLILGVGADNGVHVLHDYRERDRRRRYQLGRATGRGIMVAALTTILGFGTLMIAQHPRAQRPGLVGAAVPFHADLIGRASGDIIVFRFRQALLGNGLKIEEIDR